MASTNDRTPLFVAACPRSGTTVLTRLLNLHPEIVLGQERYKSIYGQTKVITADMFEEERFFRFDPSETDFIPTKKAKAAEFYERAREKYATARFVGDKYPQFFRFYGRLFTVFPNARVVFIVRQPLSVAQSWQRRADDSTSWPAKNDARRSVSYWNDALVFTLAHAKVRPASFVFVEYEKLFKDKRACLAELFRLIGANVEPAVLDPVLAEAESEFQASEDIMARPLELPREVQDAVLESADQVLYRGLRDCIAAQE